VGPGALILPKAFFDALTAGSLHRRDVGLSVALRDDATILEVIAGGETHSFAISRAKKNGKIHISALFTEHLWAEDARGWEVAGRTIRGAVEAAWVGSVFAND
jgi:hypothetical protein